MWNDLSFDAGSFDARSFGPSWGIEWEEEQESTQLPAGGSFKRPARPSNYFLTGTSDVSEHPLGTGSPSSTSGGLPHEGGVLTPEIIFGKKETGSVALEAWPSEAEKIAHRVSHPAYIEPGIGKKERSKFTTLPIEQQIAIMMLFDEM